MSLVFNGTTVEDVVYNGVTLCKLVYNGTLVWENHAYSDWVTTAAATCTTAGSKKRTCSRTDCGGSETVTIKALGHKCLETIIDPTCTEQGYTLHECTRDGCLYSYKDSYLDIDSTNHSYGSPTYAWSGNTSCTATRTCKNDSSHKETANATITNAITKAATCTTAGVRTYTATFSESWASTQTKTASISATGHSYLGTVYAWATDNSTCTARRICSKDSSHIETQTVTATYAVTTAAKCTTTGTGTYTAKFNSTTDWSLTTQTKDVTIPATGHTSVAYPYVAPTTTSIGYTGGTYCSTCGAVLTARTPILANPEFTDVILSDQAYTVDVWVKNNNSLPVTCYLSILDDDDTDLGSKSVTISANSTSYVSIEYNSSAVFPIYAQAIFEADGYAESDYTVVDVS